MGTFICRKIISAALLVLLGVTLCSATRSFSHPSGSFEDSTGGYGGFPGSFEGSTGGYGGFPSGFAGYGGFPSGYGSGYGGIKDQIPNSKDEAPSTTPTKAENIGTDNTKKVDDKDKIGVGHDTTVGGPDEDHQGDENSGYDGYGGGYGGGYGYGCYCSYPGGYGGYPWDGYGHGSPQEKVTSTKGKKNGATP